MPQKQPRIEVVPLGINRDLSSVAQIWAAALPNYPLPAENLRKLLPQPNAHHFVARTSPSPSSSSKTVGFCLAYTTRQHQKNPTERSTSGYISVLAVHPENQGQGIGSTLLNETKSWFKQSFDSCHLEIGSGFPRFWPGVPKDLPDAQRVLDFFIERGFQVRPDPPRSVDLYRDLRNFSLNDGEYVQRAEKAGYTFSPLRPEGYEECLAGQERNFSHNPDWVDMYHLLDPAANPSSIMTAFDSQGAQVGWTLMLPPSSSVLQENWAMPAVCGPKTGLVGCVGVDDDHRGSGVGLALVAHALEDMRKRGMHGVFVDWVSLEGFYERVGLEVWCAYRGGEIE